MRKPARRLALVPILLAAFAASEAAPRLREIGPDEAKRVVLTAARHDNIYVNDRTIVLNSMDTRSRSGFLPGYYSFSIIRESESSDAADETIRMFVVSKRTAETWELNLCKRYSFPELDRLQKALMRETGATPDEERDMARRIGCSAQTATLPAPTPPTQ